MSILHSTNSGSKAVKISSIDLFNRGFVRHKDFTYLYKDEPTHEIKFRIYNDKIGYYTRIWFIGPKTRIETVYQLEMLLKYWNTENSKDMNYYAYLIDPEYKH